MINKEDSITLNDGRFQVSYGVTDPVEYYFVTHGYSSDLLQVIEKELANHALEGKPVNTEELLRKMIEGMRLPIALREISSDGKLKAGSAAAGAR